MSDELRDRIAGLIWQNSSLTSEGAADIAQTIIEDLGLVEEERIDMPGSRGINPVHRVVGRWETGE